MREIFLAGEETQKRAPLLRRVMANGATQRRKPFLQRVEHRSDRDGTVDVE
jgi:hypothetical protein